MDCCVEKERMKSNVLKRISFLWISKYNVLYIAITLWQDTVINTIMSIPRDLCHFSRRAC